MAHPVDSMQGAAEFAFDGDAFLSELRERPRPLLARAISLVEREDAGAAALLSRLQPCLGHAWRVGLTGPPGAGKSTLLSAMVEHAVGAGCSAAVLAVDPSSPFSHGALLGDRVRMSGIDHGDRVYIRSLATRGESGGLSAAVAGAADVLDAAGFDYVFIESAGVGQVELDIGDAVDVTLVVLVPESGDEVQAIKAGVLEIADLYVINKSDRPGAGMLADRVQASPGAAERFPGWRPPVLCAAAAEGQGIAEVMQALHEHRRRMEEAGLVSLRRADRLRQRLRRMVERAIRKRLWADPREARLAEAAAEVGAGRCTLQEAVERLLPEILAGMQRESGT